MGDTTAGVGAARTHTAQVLLLIGVLLAVGCAALAFSTPDEARPLFGGATVLAVVASLASVVVVRAARLAEREPTPRRPLARLGALVPVLVGAWLVVVLGVGLVTRDLGWAVGAAGLAVLLLPVLVAIAVVRGAGAPR